MRRAEHRDLLRDGRLTKLEPHRRTILAEAADQSRQASIERAADVRYAHRTGLPLCCFLRRLDGPAGLADRAPGLLEEGGSRRREPNGAVPALDQLGADLFLQLAHRSGERRSRHVQAGRRFVKVKLLRDRDELPELAQIDHAARPLLRRDLPF